MKLSLSFPELEAQRKRIGAALSEWMIGTPGLSPREKLLAELEAGIEIDIGDIQIGPGKLLTFKGEQVLLYIKDTRASRATLENEPEKSRRFHVAECQTLETMRSAGRFERYVVTNRMDGRFLVDWLDHETGQRGETEAELKVCKNCLGSLNWRGYERPDGRLQLPSGMRQSRSEIWQNFAIPDFLMEYSTFFRAKPSRRDHEATLNIYVEDWPRISEQKRREARWRCEDCGVDLASCPGLLHCHHRNGVVTDNSPSNLKVLCAIDHAAQPGHHHMRVSASDRLKITSERARQGIRPN